MHLKPGRAHRFRATVVAFAIAGAAFAVAPPAAAQKPSLGASAVQAIEIVAKPIVSFDRPGTDRKRFGRLEWRGGLVLTSPSEHFGGWSGLTISPDGKRILAISDAGTWMTADLAYNDGRPAGLHDAKVGPLLGVGGRPLTRNRDRDAEGVTLASGTLDKGTVLISFEGNHRIGRFRIDSTGISAPIGYLRLPPEAKRMKRNSSLESVAVLQGGRYKGSTVAFAERLPNNRGDHTGWIWIDGNAKAFYLSDPGEFDITDAVGLPDGGLLVLERRFRWTEGVKMRLRLLTANELAPGASLQGETLFEANMSYDIDNMEGIATHTGPRGETIITLISDNNFNTLIQRTILLQFGLAGESTAKASTPQK